MFGPFLNLESKSIDNGFVFGHHLCTKYGVMFLVRVHCCYIEGIDGLESS
ncbi:hypothetical protein V6Z12_D11G384900 [Gossypium hirsutum]